MRLSVLLLICLAASLAAGAPIGICLDKNPFLKKLQDNGVQVHETPEVDPGHHCNEEWGTHMTCCEADSLTTFASEDASIIRRNVEKVNKEFITFLMLVKALNNTVFKLAALESFDWQPLVKSAVLKSKLFALIQYLKSDFLKRSWFFSYNDPEIESKFPEANSRCWESMILKRSSALCSTCSGRSELFFLNNKANIEDTICSELINTCWYSFKLASRYFSNLVSIGSVRHLNKISNDHIIKISNSQLYNSSRASKLISKYEEDKSIYFEKLEYLFQNSVSLTKLELEQKEKATAGLCKRFMSIQGYPWIRSLDRTIMQGAQPTLTLTESITTLFAEVSSMYGSSNFKEEEKKLYSDYHKRYLMNYHVKSLPSSAMASRVLRSRSEAISRNLARDEEEDLDDDQDNDERFVSDVNVLKSEGNSWAEISDSICNRQVAIEQIPMNLSNYFP